MIRRFGFGREVWWWEIVGFCSSGMPCMLREEWEVDMERREVEVERM